MTPISQLLSPQPALPVIALNLPALFLSDLHLGSRMTLVRSVESLSPLLDGFKSVVFCGDTIDTFHWPDATSDERAKTAECAKNELIRLLEKLAVRPVFITGNHDPDISNIHACAAQPVPARQILATHGDLFTLDIASWSAPLQGIADWFIARADAEGRRINRMLPDDLDWVRQRYLEFVRVAPERRNINAKDRSFYIQLLHKIARPWLIWRVFRERYRCHQLADAFATMREPGADLCFFGHYHYPKIKRSGNRYNVCLGSFTHLSRPLGGVVRSDGQTDIRMIRKTKTGWRLDKTIAVIG